MPFYRRLKEFDTVLSSSRTFVDISHNGLLVAHSKTFCAGPNSRENFRRRAFTHPCFRLGNNDSSRSYIPDLKQSAMSDIKEFDLTEEILNFTPNTEHMQPNRQFQAYTKGAFQGSERTLTSAKSGQILPPPHLSRISTGAFRNAQTAQISLSSLSASVMDAFVDTRNTQIHSSSQGISTVSSSWSKLGASSAALLRSADSYGRFDSPAARCVEEGGFLPSFKSQFSFSQAYGLDAAPTQQNFGMASTNVFAPKMSKKISSGLHTPLQNTNYGGKSSCQARKVFQPYIHGLCEACFKPPSNHSKQCPVYIREQEEKELRKTRVLLSSKIFFKAILIFICDLEFYMYRRKKKETKMLGWHMRTCKQAHSSSINQFVCHTSSVYNLIQTL